MAYGAMPVSGLAAVIVAYSVLTAVEANYTLEIMVHGYRNPAHLSLGQALFRHGCCEGDRDLPCSPCDNSFQFCLRNITGEPHDGCEIGYMESELVAEDDDDLTFSPGDDIGGLTNPMLFSGETWPGMIELLFTVYDLDGSVTVDTQSDLVDTILITPMISAVPSQDYPFTEAMTFSGNFSELDLSFRLTCGEDFYGPDCTVFCVDTNDTSSGHYTCDNSTGEKVCLEGYRNSDTNCTECAPRQSCSPVGGYCSEPGECLCREGFVGDNCSVATHPCYLEPCMNGGVCRNATQDPEDYVCECVARYRGQNCSETDECEPDPCVHGNCTDLHMDYTCTCDEGYEGKNCETDTDDCVSVLCGGHGTCLDGLASFTCSCETGYSGELCEELDGSGSSTLLVIVVATVGGVLVALISAVLIAIVLLLCRKRKLSKAGEEGVPNPYETPTHFPYNLNGGPNGLEKNFDNPLYIEGSVSPPLPPRPEHPYATLEGAADRYESIPTASLDSKPEQKEESPYLNPVNPMDSSTVVYAHIQ